METFIDFPVDALRAAQSINHGSSDAVMVTLHPELIATVASVVRPAGVLAEMKRPVLLLFHPDGGHATTYDDMLAGLEYVISRVLK